MPQTSHTPVRSLVLRFIKAEDESAYLPTSMDIQTASGAIRSSKSTDIEKAASAFCLAMGGVDREVNIQRMVRYGVKAWPADSEMGDGHSALPDALFCLLARWKSEAATGAIARLRFDGGPAELLSSVRGETFLKYPAILAKAWGKLPGKERPLLKEDLSEEALSDSELRMALRRGLRSKNAAIRALSSVSLKKE